MKSKRHAVILEIINSKDIETQEDLANELKKTGIDVKQSTLSRDIKELRLTKVLSDNKKYKYVSIAGNHNVKNDKLMRIFAQTVINVEKVDKFIVIKTISGSAPAAAEAIDTLQMDGIAGTIAGDNTIFILMRDEEKAQIMIGTIVKLINK